MNNINNNNNNNNNKKQSIKNNFKMIFWIVQLSNRILSLVTDRLERKFGARVREKIGLNSLQLCKISQILIVFYFYKQGKYYLFF